MLRTRLMLVRFHSGDTDRSLVNHLAQVLILTRFVRQAGYGDLELKTLDDIEMALGTLLVEFDETGKWAIVSDGVIHGLTKIINEYDRLLGTVRMEILVRASAYLDRLVDAARPTDAS
ncbi:hypothetical protein [Paraburkholderia fungorum]|uniref:hypothetical protein n=1 Tax=Paraburkholderia fungorum TaxID=134537 RepID=UPI00209A6EDB|nr:hypothetical protein [Paraburkholderia fungorum]